MDAQGYTYLRAFRYERKFLVEDLQPFQVAALIRQHPRLFHSPYPSRFVNNLYLDSAEMSDYYDNVNGAAKRRKVRVRWYGDPFGEISHPMLEVKVKVGEVGTKHTYPLASFCLDPRFCSRAFRDVLAHSDLPPEARLGLHSMDVVLFNRYYRDYYATCEGDFRLTMDTNLEFYKVNGCFSNRFVHHQVNMRHVVVELKYETAQEQQANRVAGFFPFRPTRNSKYVQGIERVYF